MQDGLKPGLHSALPKAYGLKMKREKMPKPSSNVK